MTVSVAPRTFGLALAGGAGSRMGGADKARLVVGGRPLLDRALAALGAASRVAVAGGARIRPADAPGVVVLADPRPGLGPLAGLAAGLAWAEDAGADWLLTAPVDAPFLAPSVYVALLAAAAPGDVAVVAGEGG
ncbi:NTP transferase domain-containing protein, partial [Roseitalea porphyridii]|uniref:NTP transferase domain-containing protein n=1 Tax=Roseitalea porphyridii TaxID=1852022 RepID=UPI0032EEFA45